MRTAPRVVNVRTPSRNAERSIRTLAKIDCVGHTLYGGEVISMRNREAPMQASRFWSVAAVVLVSFSLAPLQAEELKQNIQRLLRMCKADPGSVDAAWCAGYIAGISDQMHLNGQVLHHLDIEPNRQLIAHMSICTEESYTAKVEAFMTWAEKHPALWDQPYRLGVMTALHETWRCR
jgi:hypothetical protein